MNGKTGKSREGGEHNKYTSGKHLHFFRPLLILVKNLLRLEQIPVLKRVDQILEGISLLFG